MHFSPRGAAIPRTTPLTQSNDSFRPPMLRIPTTSNNDRLGGLPAELAIMTDVSGVRV